MPPPLSWSLPLLRTLWASRRSLPNQITSTSSSTSSSSSKTVWHVLSSSRGNVQQHMLRRNSRSGCLPVPTEEMWCVWRGSWAGLFGEGCCLQGLKQAWPSHQTVRYTRQWPLKSDTYRNKYERIHTIQAMKSYIERDSMCLGFPRQVTQVTEVTVHILLVCLVLHAVPAACASASV